MSFMPNRKQIALLLIDAFSVAGSLYFALLLRFDFAIEPVFFDRYVNVVLIVTFIQLFIFYIFGLYRRIWQYASIEEMNTVLFAVTTSSAIIYVYTYILEIGRAHV